MEGCNECKTILKEMQENENIETEEQEIDYLKGIKHKMNKKSIIITITTILLIILVLFNIVVYKNYKEYAENVEIFLDLNITEEEKLNIEKTIKEVAEAVEIEYISSEDALEKLKQNFGDNAYMLDGYNENPETIFPSSYVIKTKISNVKKIKEKVEVLPGVKKISTHIDVNPYVVTYVKLRNEI